MTNREDTVRWWIINAISKCPWIPMERAKRAKKIGAYVKQEQEREKHPEQVAQTIADLQEQVLHLQEQLQEERN